MSPTRQISSLPDDILHSHILIHLDAKTLASATCASTVFSAGRRDKDLWSAICHATWPSTASDRITNLISTYGYRSFFSQSFPLPSPDPTTIPEIIMGPVQSHLQNNAQTSPPSTTVELISTVDIRYRNEPIFAKTDITETAGDWFRCSPFRIDLVDPKDAVATSIPNPVCDATCMALMEDMTLSWILIDPVNKLSVNVSSNKPVSVHRHWLSGEVQLRYVSILAADGGGEVVQCRIVVDGGVSEDGKMQLREVMMEMEDMDGKLLDGRGSLVILKRVMEGKRGNGVNREEEARRRYRRFEEMKREMRDRKERKSRIEGVFDILSLVFGLSVSVGLSFVLVLKTLLWKQREITH